MLLNNHSGLFPEVGCDEAGRGCLAGPVFAAAVILPAGFYHPGLNDSKKINEKNRFLLREVIEKNALSFAVASLDVFEIDKYNILWAAVRTMHKAIENLQIKPAHIIVDGNKFIPYKTISHDCIVGGDGIYTSIAAASILAKTYRDEFMCNLHHQYPQYQWDSNKGYPTLEHRAAILKHGPCEYHRQSFRLLPKSNQILLFDKE